jgi:hypothetical protein
MDRKAAKELVHIDGWLVRVVEIIQRGKDAYLDDDLLQEAGDSLMMNSARRPIGCRVSVSWLPTGWTGHSPSRIAISSFTSTTRSTVIGRG